MDEKPKTNKSGAIQGSKPPYEFKKCPKCGKSGWYRPTPWYDLEKRIEYVFPERCWWCPHTKGDTVCVDPDTGKSYPDVTSLMAARNAPKEERPLEKENLTKEDKKKKVKEMFK